jgi:hypothetical protein
LGKFFDEIYFIINIEILVSSNNSIILFLTKQKLSIFQTKYTTHQPVLSVPTLIRNLTFSVDKIYHHDGIAYDYYSKNDLGQSKANFQWRIWPLPNEINQNSSRNDIEISPFVVSKLPFIDVIYVMTDPRLTERQNNLKKSFDHQGISLESIKWRMKWNSTTCNSNSSHSYVYQRLNLKDEPLGNSLRTQNKSSKFYLIFLPSFESDLDTQQQRRCALTMKHTDVWYEMAEEKVGLGLILEDDAIFVPFFKEKFTRMISAAINEGILRINRTCIKSKEKPISNDERIDQNPMIVIGTCLNMHSPHFQRHLLNAPPILSTHKPDPSRCSHAYLLTSCSAQALVDQIQLQKNEFLNSDHMKNHLFRLSSTLQSFWLDPPLSYQGNQVIDLDKMNAFKGTTY